jgi:hypothetical protein
VYNETVMIWILHSSSYSFHKVRMLSYVQRWLIARWCLDSPSLVRTGQSTGCFVPSPCRITSAHSVLHHTADTNQFFSLCKRNTHFVPNTLCYPKPSIHPVFFEYCHAYNLSRCQELVRHEQACKQYCSLKGELERTSAGILFWHAGVFWLWACIGFWIHSCKFHKTCDSFFFVCCLRCNPFINTSFYPKSRL